MTIQQAKFYLKNGMSVWVAGFRCALRVRGIRRGKKGTEVLCDGNWSPLNGRPLVDVTQATGEQ